MPAANSIENHDTKPNTALPAARRGEPGRGRKRENHAQHHEQVTHDHDETVEVLRDSAAQLERTVAAH